MTAPFYARGDTATPVKASLTAVAINIGFKILLMGPLAQVGLAIATAIGAWVNLGLVVWFAARAGILGTDARLKRSLAMLGLSGIVMAIGLYLATGPVTTLVQRLPVFRDESALIALAVIGAVLYVRVDTRVARPPLAARFSCRLAAVRCGRQGRLTHCKKGYLRRDCALRPGRPLKPKLFVPI